MQKNTFWDEGYEEAIRRAWRPKAGRRYADFVYDQRTGEQQQYMPDNVLEAWKKYWATDEFKAKSAQASKNRLSGEGGPSKHSGGSITFRTHWERMVNL